MKVTKTDIPEVKLLEPTVFEDDRGFFFETYHAEKFLEEGLPADFVQDNHSSSAERVLRGLHYQEPNPQGKLVRCVRGAIFDVAVDIRKGSPTYAKWVGYRLDEKNKHMLWVPPGFAHGFCTISDGAEVVYKCTAVYVPKDEHRLAWNDPDIGIKWRITDPLLSPKDAAAPRLKDVALLPKYKP